MLACETIKNCRVRTSFRHEGVLISVGISVHEGERFLTCCLRDSIAGCQHLHTRPTGAILLIERIASAFRLLSALA